MKKVLFATTALVATAGVAAAEVSLSGSAEIGIVDGSGMPAMQFHHDLDVKFTLSGETDNGLTFGATIDLDEIGDDSHDDGGGDGISSGGTGAVEEHSVFVSGNFGTVTMGDTDGAFDWALTEVGIGSAIADDHTTHAGFNGNSGLDGATDGQILRYDNTFGDFGVAISVELDDTNAAAAGDTWGIGLKYSAALGGVDLGIGLGYQDNDVNNVTGISLDAQFAGGFRAILNYSDYDTTADHTGIGVGYSSGPLTVSANYGEFDGGADGFGVAVNYDLGGMAVQFGYGDDSTGFDQWSLGLAMSF